MPSFLTANQHNTHTPTNRKSQSLPISPPQTDAITMCYNTGTFPSTLCNKPSFLSSITPFDSPKFITLGDEKTLVPALGEGTLDYIDDNKYRMQEDAILTSCTPVALKSAASHISHNECTIHGNNNEIIITYPTFSHTVTAANKFEFPIVTPGTNSSLPILWSPNHGSTPPLTLPRTKSRKQKVASK